MAKTGKPSKIYVAKHDEKSRVPFLRGILTRSLQNSGLSFEEAYRSATEIRQEIDSDETIDLDDLSDLIFRHLHKRYSDEIVKRYQCRHDMADMIIVKGLNGEMTPFSPVRLSQCLSSCALPQDISNTIAQKVNEKLSLQRISETSTQEICQLVYRTLENDIGKEIARQYLTWVAFQRSGRPLMLLMGGITGTGKSTLASKISHMLNIVRIQSTDILREVMRLMVSESLMPALHASSYLAWKTLPHTHDPGIHPRTLLIDGFRAQAKQVSVAIDGVFQRAKREHVPLILEGVHLHPAYMSRLSHDSEKDDAIIVPLMLAVLSKQSLHQHIQRRSNHAPSRRANRYLKHLDAIWNIQSFLLSEAERYQIPVIPNLRRDRAEKHLLALITDTLSQKFSGNPKHLLSL